LTAKSDTAPNAGFPGTFFKNIIFKETRLRRGSIPRPSASLSAFLIDAQRVDQSASTAPMRRKCFQNSFLISLLRHADRPGGLHVPASRASIAAPDIATE